MGLPRFFLRLFVDEDDQRGFEILILFAREEGDRGGEVGSQA